MVIIWPTNPAALFCLTETSGNAIIIIITTPEQALRNIVAIISKLWFNLIILLIKIIIGTLNNHLDWILPCHVWGLRSLHNRMTTGLLKYNGIIDIRYIYRLHFYIDPVTPRVHAKFIWKEKMLLHILCLCIKSHGVTILMKPLKQCFIHDAIHFVCNFVWLVYFFQKASYIKDFSQIFNTLTIVRCQRIYLNSACNWNKCLLYRKLLFI